MNINTKQLLEVEGCEVIEGKFDFKYRTRIFIRHPDGRLNPYYDALNTIPELPNGTEFDLNIEAMPYDSSVHGDTAQKGTRSIIHAEMSAGADSLVFVVTAGMILLSIIMLAIVICIYYMLHPPAQEPPCKTEERIIDVSDCAKIIIMPNCDSRMFDACSDTWLEEDWHTWTPSPDWITWIIVGAIAIGGIVVLSSFLKPRGTSFLKPQKKPSKNGSKWQGSPAWVNY